jgi:hypothetical protein
MFQKLFSRSQPQLAKKQKIVIVSGLPRSGTSMMMKMLATGGLSIVTDNEREADDDNPNGYFEIESSKRLKDGEVDWIYGAQGKAVKVISYLLEYLPEDLAYDIIFMDREISEILASQKKMLQRRNEQSLVSDNEMGEQFRSHVKAVKYWVARKPNMRVMYVNYTDMVSDPEALCSSITEFLGLPLNVDAMKSVPNKELYRNRS